MEINDIVCRCGGKLVWEPTKLFYRATCIDCGQRFDLTPMGWPHASFCSTGTIAHGEPITLTTEIIVNGKKHTIDGDVLSYAKAVELAGKAGRDDVFVAYWCRREGDLRREGHIRPGQSVQAELGMVVTAVIVT